MANATEITDRIYSAVLGKKLLPGAPLAEVQLAALFDCSRTIVREALNRLSERGVVTIGNPRGWRVVELSEDQARETFEARLVLETGLLRRMKAPGREALRGIKAHLARQKAALAGDDPGLRSFLLGDFHVCLAECLGNRLLADTMRAYTARTMLVAARHQSVHDAASSYEEHAGIVAALVAGDMVLAEQLMAGHLGTWQDKLPLPAPADPLSRLRQALSPTPITFTSTLTSTGEIA